MPKILKFNDRQEKVEQVLNVIAKLHGNLEGKVTAIGTLLDTQQKNLQRHPGSDGNEVDREDRTDVNACHRILRDAS